MVPLGPDTLVLRDFQSALEQEFDLGLTMRSDLVVAAMDDEPFDAVVILARAGGAPRAQSFFNLCLHHFAEIENRAAFRGFYPEGLRAWRGAPVLPAAVVGWREFFEHVLSGRTSRIQINDCIVAFFESKLYNCSKPPAAWDAAEPFIPHCKGAQKERMLCELRIG